MDEVNQIRQVFFRELETAEGAKRLEEIRVKYLGRQAGELTRILRSLKDFPLMKRREIGPAANALRAEIERALKEKIAWFQSQAREETVDITRPGIKIVHGHLHPLTQLENEVKDVFRSLNFSVLEGPEVESEYYNFDALNIPPNHPARDAWDTFWLKTPMNAGEDADQRSSKNNPVYPRSNPRESALLRTHTSPMQIRYMERHSPPIQIIVPGRVFRYEATDATHETMFHQVEGLMVGKDISIANCKYSIGVFLKRIFGARAIFELRPSLYPFVEPGFDVYMKRSGAEGWLEVAGAGMVHPKVFSAVGYNPKLWQGFAFGFGLDRLAMLKYDIPDIRLFYSGDLRFISQF